MEFILSEQNLVFNIALLLMLGIALLEGVGALVGFGLSQIVDSLIPDINGDLDFDAAAATPMTSFLGWLHIGRVPLLILLIVFLASFGVLGLILQRIVLNSTGQLWSGTVAFLPAFLASLPCVSVFGGMLEKLFPGDESEAISEDDFIGAEGTVVLGEGRVGKPTQVKLTDKFGQDHYLLAEPENNESKLLVGEKIKITDRQGNIYKALQVKI